MGYNVLSNMTEVVGYLQQAAGFTYLQSPTTWSEAFKTAVEASPKLVQAIAGEASAEITNIATAYTSVGKNIYATAESGLKSAPVVEGVFTQADQEVANVGESALGTYVAGLSVGVPLATAVAGILSGLGIGILGYETTPEGWVDISNAIFGTNITYDQAQPLIRTYVQGLLASPSMSNYDHVYFYLPEACVINAYDYFASHIYGGIDYDVIDGVVWEGTTQHPDIPTKASAATESLLLNHNVDYTGSIDDNLLNFMAEVINSASARYEFDPVLNIDFTGVINNLYELYPNFHNASLFDVIYSYERENNTNYVVINGFNLADDYLYGVNIHNERELVFNILEDYEGEYTDALFSYGLEYSGGGNINPYGTHRPLFSYKYDFNTGVGIVRDDGNYYANSTSVHINIFGNVNIAYNRNIINAHLWNVGASDGIVAGFDEEFQDKGYILEPKLDPNVDPELAQKKPTTKTNFQDQYAYWYGGKKRVGQPDKNGEPSIITYIPTPIPIQYPNPALSLEEGIGVADNPNSLPVEIPNAMPYPYPNAVPENAPGTNIADDLDNAVQNYNDSRVTPSTAPESLPEYEPNPQYPENPPNDPSGDTGTTPVPGDIPGVEASGLVSVYNPTKAQLVSFSQWLWSSSFLDNFIKIFQNPMDAIIGLHVVYATPTTGQTGNIVCGYLDSGVSSKIVTKQYGEIDCGTVDVPEYFGNALDYEPYVQVHAYLPFVGIVSLKPNDILGKKLNIKYGVDYLTGACLAMLTTSKGQGDNASKILAYTFAGNCATQVPISGGSYAQMITGLAGVAVSAVAGAATGNPIALLGAGASILNTHLDVQHSGSIGSNAGAMGPRKPYLIITRKSAYEAAGYNQFYGYPANVTVSLSSCRGYTRVKSVHIDTIPVATDNEKTEIETLLKQGIIIN